MAWWCGGLHCSLTARRCSVRILPWPWPVLVLAPDRLATFPGCALPQQVQEMNEYLAMWPFPSFIQSTSLLPAETIYSHIDATIKLIYSIRTLCKKYSYAEMHLSVLNFAVIIIDFWTNDMLSMFIYTYYFCPLLCNFLQTFFVQFQRLLICW